MITKLFEVRDRGTFIPVLAVMFDPLNDAERFLLGWAGYGQDAATQAGYILVQRLHDIGHKAGTCNPGEQNSPTMQEAHRYIVERFGILATGDVIDCEFIRCERPEPRRSERFGTLPVGKPLGASC